MEKTEPLMLRIEFGKNIARAALTCAVLLASAELLLSAEPPQFSAWSAAVKVGPPISTYNDNPLIGDDEACPFIAKNNLDLYFRSNAALDGAQGGYDIYVSHRETVDEPWEDPINLGPMINTQWSEYCSFVTIDGHWLYFVSDRPVAAGGCGGQDIWVSHRKDKRDDDGWEEPTNLGCSTINSSGTENGPSLLEDEATGATVLYFTSNRAGAGAGGPNIWSSRMVGEDHATFELLGPVVELNTDVTDMQPFVRRKDGLEIIFVSTRGSTGQDLWSSTRPDTSSLWSAPVNLGTLVNSTGNAGRPSLSWDGTTLYFWTTRDGSYDVYMTTRTKLPD